MINPFQDNEADGAVGLPPAFDLARTVADERGDLRQIRRFTALQEPEHLHARGGGSPAQPRLVYAQDRDALGNDGRIIDPTHAALLPDPLLTYFRHVYHERVLLELLLLKGCIVTIDAMGCQTAIAQTIIDREADDVLALKENQETLSHEVQHLFADAEETGGADDERDHAKTVDGGDGRVESRRSWTISDQETIAHLDPDGEWAGLRGIGMVEAERREQGKVSRETRYFLTSLTDAAPLGRAVRGHWGIENGLHWVLDRAFREDESRVRVGHGAANLVVLRHRVVNLLRRERTAKVGIKAKRLKAGWDEQYLLNILAHYDAFALGRIGDERLGAHRDTPCGKADDWRESLSHSGALLSVTKAGEEPISRCRIQICEIVGIARNTYYKYTRANEPEEHRPAP